jgi:general L-amino acid transport system permease protein
VIVPPLTSQYVSLIKNSSIAVVVGYPDLVNIGNTVMNQTGQAVEAIAVMMTVYLIISVVTSLLMNTYNRLVAIKER